MIRKIYIVFIIATLVLLITSCQNKNINDEAVSLEHLIIPSRLLITTKEGFQKTQEFGPMGSEIAEMQKRISTLTEKEKVKLEEVKDRLYQFSYDIERETILIDDKDVINSIINKIKTKVAYPEEISESDSDNLKYYNVVAFYEEETNEPQIYIENNKYNLTEGYILHFTIIENDTLIFNDGMQSQIFKIQFKYDWFEKQINSN